MNKTAQLLCAWSVLVFLALLAIGWWPLAGFLPPIASSLDAQAVAEIYQNHTAAMRTGFLLIVLGSGFYVPFSAAIATQMQRIEGVNSVLAKTQMGAGIMVVTLIIMPVLIWSVAAYRPERAPELTQLLNDLGWICLIMPASPAMVQVMAVGIAALIDKSPTPVYPRWIGYLGLWLAVIFLPGLLLTYFKTGAFAWNGVLAFWLPVSLFFGWMILMAWMTHRAIVNQPDAG